MRVLSRIKDWMEKFASDELSPEEIMEIRAREGTLSGPIMKRGVKKVFHSLRNGLRQISLFIMLFFDFFDDVVSFNDFGF